MTPLGRLLGLNKIIRTGSPRWDWLFRRKEKSWAESYLLSFAIAPQTPVLLKRRLWKIVDPHLPFCHWMAVHLHPCVPLRRSCSVSIILTCPHWRGNSVEQGLSHWHFLSLSSLGFFGRTAHFPFSHAYPTTEKLLVLFSTSGRTLSLPPRLSSYLFRATLGATR